ncbi:MULTISPECIES: RICIN domain-containing protein [unclassified Chryseobacterium]|uniref:DUF3472 domain-containing protein n=1 Tax=unclassified Chryseobacterium TaxID=2593645 RepID=UPI002269A483|nr:MULTISPECIES: RICIN domain-containing protein [unclassified Chryseobacterium]
MNKKFKRFASLFALASTALFCTSKAQVKTCPSWGPYISGLEMTNSGELWYSEVMADDAGKKINTYYSTLGFYLGSRGGYAGIQYKSNDNNNIFSMWDLQDTNIPQCTTEYTAPNTFVNGFGGEGTGLHTSNPMPWTAGVWYATVVRRWSVGDGKTRIGFFMYDYGTKKWKHYVTIVTPENDAKFTGNSLGGFVENWAASLNKDTRYGYFRNFWSMNAQGNWSKPSKYKAEAGTGSWGATSAFNNTAIKVSSCGTAPAPTGSIINFTNISQPGTKPSTAAPIIVTTVTPTYNSSTSSVNVTWANSETTSPQLSYKVSLYTEASWANGYTPITSVSGIRPDQRSASVPLPANSQPGKYYVSVVLEDIFKQGSNFGYNNLTISSIPTVIDTNAYYRIKSVGSNQYITPANYSTSANTKIVQYPFNSNPAQQWKFEKKGNNYIIVNRASGLVIDLPYSNTTNGTNLNLYNKLGGNNQQWVMKSYESNRYIIGTAVSNMKSMDLPANTQAQGANINIWDQDINGSAGINHQWVLEKVTASAAKVSANTDISTDTLPAATVYPNPVKQGENLYINLPENKGNYELIIVNAEGLPISKMLISGKVTISTSNMRSGIYFYKAKSSTGTISGKFSVR